MSRISSRNTSPERIIKKHLRALGIKYKGHVKTLPGKPDFAFPAQKRALFIHGCFWHHHKGCNRANIPQTNRRYWLKKIRTNHKRDKRQLASLRKSGWKPEVIWECQIKNEKKLNGIITKCIRSDGQQEQKRNVQAQ